jgi:hypothetical protein
MNAIRTLAGAAVLMIATVARPAVVVQEPPTAEQQTNFIGEGNFSSGRIGAPPPKPWQYSKSTEKVRVTVETPAGRPAAERWVRLVDESDQENANIRQSVAPVRSVRFQARLISNKHGGRLFMNLGSGAASKPEERVVQLSIDSDGSLVVRGAQKSKTSTQIKAGEVYLVRCHFEPIDGKAGIRVVAELVEESSQRHDRVETETETPMAITAVRVTSLKADTGVDYYVTDLSLTGR